MNKSYRQMWVKIWVSFHKNFRHCFPHVLCLVPFLGVYHDLSRLITKPTKWLCAQRRLRSAWASAQSDQSLRCPHEETLGPQLPIQCTAKTLIRLGGCPGWSESSLGAQIIYWFCYETAHFISCLHFFDVVGWLWNPIVSVPEHYPFTQTGVTAHWR